jgi:hypothetical protein
MNKQGAIGALIAIAAFELLFFTLLVSHYFGFMFGFDLWLLFGAKYVVLAAAVVKVYDPKVLSFILLAGVGLDVIVVGLMASQSGTSTMQDYVLMLISPKLHYVGALIISGIFLAAYAGFATLRRQGRV